MSSKSIASWQSRTRLLIGDEALKRLSSSCVLAVGLGGVGGMAAEMIARAGVGRLILVDGDTVDDTNRNRQIPALASTVGRLKTEVMRDRISDVAPEAEIKILSYFLTEENVPAVFDENRIDCVLDAIDSLGAKTALIAEAVKRGIPVVSSMGSGAKLDPELVREADISKTKVCPLARAVRRKLKEMGITKGVTSIYSEEPSVEGATVIPDAESGSVVCGKRAVSGTISYMPNLFGCHCAASVIKKLISAK